MPPKTALTLIFAVAALNHGAQAADAPSKPPPAPATVPSLMKSRPMVVCVGCDVPFDTASHEKLLKGLVNNPYVGELRKALYTQDVLHQFESKAHFDNCDFDGAIAYVNLLYDEIGQHAEAIKAAQRAKNAAAVQQAAKKAFFAVGQLLHAAQDFYAHSNYVELQVPAATKVTQIPLIRVWRAADQQKLSELRVKGLYSGFVIWGVPQKCPSGTPTHGELAKDSDNTPSGKKIAANLGNMSYYRVAMVLARESSTSFLEDAFAKWPVLAEINGKTVAFDVIVDRRAL